ncbi:MAG: LLM class F420-dependent oxidoreductase [Thermoprotei archaeon]|nr:MAG: LLM class F420-dependent oxidoreductase [Thermoprotei archaeon]
MRNDLFKVWLILTMPKFGVFVPQGWRLDLPPTATPQEQWRLIVNVARYAEKLGYDSLWVFDHFHTVPKPLKGRSVFEAWTVLTALATLTNRIRLGTLVTCIFYRHPSVLAKLVANVDVISNGRVILGLGACWYEHEFRGYGIEFYRPAKRIKMLEESIQIIKLMWTKDEVYFDGKYYKLEGALNDPKPVQKPHPPILVGGVGEKLTLRVVAKYADMWHCWGDPDYYARKIAILKEHCSTVGRDYNEIVKVHDGFVIMGDTEEEVKRKFQEVEFFKIGKHSYESMKESQYIGTPEEIIKKIQKYIDLGIEEIIFYFPDAYRLKPLEEFMEKVLREFK